MRTASIELVLDVAVMLIYTVVGGALTVLGAVAEYMSVQHLGAGEMTVALWLAALGVVMLYGGLYGIGYEKLLSPVLQ